MKAGLQPMRISVFGLGYVGSVMAACLAQLGHHLIGVDVNLAKVETLNAGRSPIVESGMDELIAEQRSAGRLEATTDAARALSETDLSFICVGTPSLRNGKLDVSGIIRVSEELGRALAGKQGFHSFAVRSTVLPGTVDSVIIPALERTSGKIAGSGFVVCANPEFMREGSAIRDFMQPPFTLMGARDKGHLAPLRAIYSAIAAPAFEVSLTSAEMIKYVCNAFHALKVDFANEIGTLCASLDVDAAEVMNIFCADTRLNISAAYLKPGFAFGGSCLPKDVRALTHRARQLDLQLPLLEALIPSNQAHMDRALEQVLATRKRKVGMLGLSFKAGTDDLRESPLLYLAKRLVGEGMQVRIFDPDVRWSCIHGGNRQFAESEIPHIASLLCPLEDVLEHAEVVVIGNHALEHHATLAAPGARIILNLPRQQATYPAALSYTAAV